jgi:hypothetical protein
MRAAARAAAVLGLALLIAACPGGDEGTWMGTPDPDAPPPPVPEAPAGHLPAVSLREMHGSGISGMAQLVSREGETVIGLRIAGAEPNAVYPARIHTGRCGDQGVERAALEPVRTDGAGQGWSETVLPIAAHELATGRDFVQVYVAPGDLHQAVACGELPELPELVPGLGEEP